ncbi:substrate-binding domain-containing protein [Buttiauxella izardii]|uniref:Molybdate ABC transporter substrate-binding protein n=1 Tax=Buttiauxella izardii TaxID=82991 RepID=A0A3A5JVC4_9ENTR|nr:substrate-binding domain-containing protein [Buttiauxella izardii]RJT24011.1 molybdate ABC transporter substrate-binding protein [Buttiauxella izardii]
MTSPFTLFAAGSLRLAFTPLLAQFTQATGIEVAVQYGPAGLLRERIEAGERCALFASANREHPQHLLANGKASQTHTFCWNQLALTTLQDGDWMELLSAPALRIGTSTPGCDPSGDYTWALFDELDKYQPGLGHQLRERAIPLVGGRDTLQIPAGELASAWILRQGFADVFIGYAHYANALMGQTDIRCVTIPAEHNILCEYQLATLENSREVNRLVDFILSHEGQAILATAGFSPVTSQS